MAIRASRPQYRQSSPPPVVQVGDNHAKAFTVAVAAAIQRVRDSVTIEEADAAIRDGSYGQVADWSLFWGLAKAAVPEVESTYLDILMEAARTQHRLHPVFSIVDERAVDIAKQDAGKLVVGIAADSRQAISDTIHQSLMGGRTVQDAARAIRDVVGLNPQRATAVGNYRLGLEAAARGEIDQSSLSYALADRRFTGLSPETIDSRVSRYAERQVASRASTIARTETMTAAHQGQIETWRAAADAGLIDRADARMVWVVTDDACDDCEELDGESASVDDGFPDGDPPLHPNCRCTLSLDTGG